MQTIKNISLNRKIMESILSLLMAFSLVSSSTAQDAEQIRFAKIISDNLVLQQQKPITLWGWASPEMEVNVTITQDATLGAAALEKLGESAVTERDNDAYSITMRYVEKNPPRLKTQKIQT